MKRYVFKTKDGFAKFIYGNHTPFISSLTDINNAHIFNEDYLNGIVAPKAQKSRKELLLDNYPGSEFLEVVVTLKEDN